MAGWGWGVGCCCAGGVLCNCFGSQSTIPLKLYATLTSNSGAPTVVFVLTWVKSCTWTAPCQVLTRGGPYGLQLDFQPSPSDALLTTLPYFANCSSPTGGGCQTVAYAYSCSPLSLEFAGSSCLFYYNKITVTQ